MPSHTPPTGRRSPSPERIAVAVEGTHADLPGPAALSQMPGTERGSPVHLGAPVCQDLRIDQASGWLCPP